ncbi:N-acetylmuramoyl-L-alanine amidase [Flavobacterium sp. 17A]|uniref:N-acetylmuramoyl-L-alanine amidase n=1 Tax=Flavobacterium potami TaxID=2872310 RepID=A0A9X1KQT1_9FLAO|nr:N-acetylmuramoyl-L-alanine amidase [Flavobacterium potami]MBZ4035830.1 N-acetylmuramoyl-L-alanine amidase [Flavobacterium potami]
MKTNKKILGIISAIFLFGLFAFIPLEEKKIIVIDAGHGGHDLGKDLYGFEEKSITESLAKKIKQLNSNANVEIILIREGDTSMELKERVAIINNIKPDLAISLHVNSNLNMKANGVQAFIPSNETFRDKSKAIAEIITDKLAATGNLQKRNTTEAPFYILKNSNCPVMTLEIGFLSNENDRNYITSEKGQNEIADKILESLN